jgi:hypothetical protein
MAERDHSYLVSIPRRSGGTYSVILHSGYFTEDEEDSEEHAKAYVTGSISDCKMSAVMTKHLVAVGAVREENLVPDDGEADDYPDDLIYDAATVRRLTAEEAETTPSDGSWA